MANKLTKYVDRDYGEKIEATWRRSWTYEISEANLILDLFWYLSEFSSFW